MKLLDSNEYDNLSSLRSDLSDTKSDIYDFYSSLRSHVYFGDEERANKEINRFVKEIEKLK